jgi:hypothetical protein
VVLGEAELLKGSAGGDLDLCGDNVDAGDFFGDGVLDLTASLSVSVHLRLESWEGQCLVYKKGRNVRHSASLARSNVRQSPFGWAFPRHSSLASHDFDTA